MNKDERYMQQCIELAKGGWGKTNPNPLVGCIIVKNDTIIGTGYHTALGHAHAEVEALQNATADVTGATLYVNLEPCSHFGRTAPCAQAIIRHQIGKVVIGMIDPNPKVSGEGIRMLRQAGIEVVSGILEEACKKLNEIYIHYITNQSPFVILKTAMTLDGKIATRTGDSKWITNEASRDLVHQLRNRVSGIVIGVNTVLTDNPLLNVRSEGPCNHPYKIIIDSKGRTPLDSNLFSTQDARVILVTTEAISENKEEQFLNAGVKILKTKQRNGQVNLHEMMQIFYDWEIDSLLLEGGGTLNASFLENNLVDKVNFFIAPKILGGKDAYTPVGGIGQAMVSNALSVKNLSCTPIGDDFLIEGYLK